MQMKNWFLSIALGFPLGVCAMQPQDMKRDVSIFENVLESALRHDVGRHVRSIQGSYLDGQGLVFDIVIRQGGQNWFSHIGANDETSMAFIELETSDLDTLAEQFSQFGEEFANVSKEVYFTTMDTVREKAEAVRRSAEQEREVNRELRELEREKRELDLVREFENNADKKEMGTRVKELENQIATLQARQSEISKAHQALKQSIEQKKAQQAQVEEKAQQELKKQLNASLSKVLCDYGSGLKSLPTDEHINFVVTGLDKKQKHIAVYSKRDVLKCVSGDWKADKLSVQAKYYTF
ncbi:hypothetical protein PALB_19420 [Pseudoalteromonas luteoviolacea B = ATCC 29581]|nr:hypothetical protein PALB_19420 [Pseudoalteromonas luteoviolacea B = ATCC 29581]